MFEIFTSGGTFEKYIEQRLKWILHKDYNYPHVSSMYISIVLYETKGNYKFWQRWRKGSFDNWQPRALKTIRGGPWYLNFNDQAKYLLCSLVLFPSTGKRRFASAFGPECCVCLKPTGKKKKSFFLLL